MPTNLDNDKEELRDKVLHVLLEEYHQNCNYDSLMAILYHADQYTQSKLKAFAEEFEKAIGEDEQIEGNDGFGNVVMHERFGKGEVINLEGVGADKKAEIKFEVGGIKKLLLRFAKLDVIG